MNPTIHSLLHEGALLKIDVNKIPVERLLDSLEEREKKLTTSNIDRMIAIAENTAYGSVILADPADMADKEVYEPFEAATLGDQQKMDILKTMFEKFSLFELQQLEKTFFVPMENR